MLEMPILETTRLIIRPFLAEELSATHQLFDVDLADADLGVEPIESLADRARWLQWVSLNPMQLAILHQPPYGDRAIVLRSSKQIIGSCGFVPCLAPFAQIPYFNNGDSCDRITHSTPEFGLFYAISPSFRRQGYASEAAQAMLDYAFAGLNLKRVVAQTSYDNQGSMGVMRRIGMRLEHNPRPDPPWLQVVGVVENDN